jgi:hypothetical protein
VQRTSASDSTFLLGESQRFTPPREMTQSKQLPLTHLLKRGNALKDTYCFIARWHVQAYGEDILKGFDPNYFPDAASVPF